LFQYPQANRSLSAFTYCIRYKRAHARPYRLPDAVAPFEINQPVYTRAGIDWIDNTTTTVLLWHLPELTPILQRTPNAFTPWKKVS
jgi:hypothetical protein